MRIWMRNMVFFLAKLRICNCGLGHLGNLLICDFRISLQLCGLQFADYITAQNFAELRLWNDPKNLRICGLTKKCVPTLVLHNGGF
jgi:hypothetical protein